jgi:hypothetical protein
MHAATHLFGPPCPRTRGAATALDAERDRAALEAIAAAVSRARPERTQSDIPSGAVYFAQFAIHDLDFRGRAGEADRGAFDLGIVYGDGPGHDAAAYRLPDRPGEPRYLLRLGLTRTGLGQPAWSVPRDLPRIACPHLDPRGREAMADVLVPNSFSDSNPLLAQVQTLWMLLHNGLAGALVERMAPAEAFLLARTLARETYHRAIRRDLLGTWLMPRLAERYATGWRLDPGAAGLPVEFMAGVGRLGHGLVRDIYALNDARPAVGLRQMMRHTGRARPHEMPLTDDWLVDFSRFFAIGSSVPQRARALGPHVARAFGTATGFGEGVSFPADGLVLRDLVASVRAGPRSVRSLIAEATSRDARVFEGCLAQDESVWMAKVGEWLTAADLGKGEAARIAADPPLLLYLMIEAEADTGGRTLGALGSIIMGETFAAALDAAAPALANEGRLGPARAAAFGEAPPASMAELVAFLQRRHRFGATTHLHPPAPATAGVPQSSTTGDAAMADAATTTRPVPRTRVTDHYEMGKLVVRWTLEPECRPHSIGELRRQLDGIAEIPDCVKTFAFSEGGLTHLAIRLPAPEMVRESLERLSDPSHPVEYPIPQFYSDHYNPGFAPILTPLDMLYARIGDYTIAQCR